eukprot:2680496-Pyramimonas_sp.AAC.2
MSRTQVHHRTNPRGTDACQHFSIIRRTIRQLQGALQHPPPMDFPFYPGYYAQDGQPSRGNAAAESVCTGDSR